MGDQINRTALSDVSAVKGAHSLSEVALCTKLNLRGDSSNLAFTKAVQSVLGVALPLAPNTQATQGEKTAFWLGPDEWIVHLPLIETEAPTAALMKATRDLHCAITDVSDYFSVIELSGPLACQIIASSSPFDTRINHFTVGQCAQTLFGHASILLWPINETPTFRLQVRWSYAQYTYAYLTQSIRNAEKLAHFHESSNAN